MATTQATITYLKRGFQWILGLFVYTNILLLFTRSTPAHFVYFNGLVVLPVIWQIVGLRLKKASLLFDFLTVSTYIVFLRLGLPALVFAGIAYSWLIFTASIFVVSWYFMRLRWFLFH